MSGPAARERVEELAHEAGATVSVWAGTPDGVAWFVRDEDAVHAAASTFKLPLLVAVLRAAQTGTLALDEALHVHDAFGSVVAGAHYRCTPDYDNDPQPWARLGDRAPVGWLAERAIVRSSNLATNLLLERVGLEAVQEVWDVADATTSRVRRGIQDAPASAAGILNEVTATDLARVVGALVGGRLLDAERTAWVRDVLGRVEDDDAMPAGLPPGTRVEHKPGWLEDTCHDVGLVDVADVDGGPFVLAVLTTAAVAPADETRLPRLVADVTRACWDARPRS